MNDLIAPVRSAIDFKAEAYRDPWSVPLDKIDVSNPYLYSGDTCHSVRVRPPHASADARRGSCWVLRP